MASNSLKKVSGSRHSKHTSGSRHDRQKTTSGLADEYLHGFSKEEQKRLYEQARYLEKSVYDGVDFSSARNLIEIGSGVGAQTEILLERFPHLKITGVDASPEQIKTATTRLKKQISKKQVQLQTGDALNLPFRDDVFDAAFLCWFLEHVSEPVGILKEAQRVLKPGAVIYCNEVMNSTFFIDPYSPATQKYWFAFNDHQWCMKGDPFVGAKLANYLIDAGFKNIQTQTKIQHYDNRTPKLRSQFIEFWIQLLLSGASGLIQAKKVDSKLMKQLTSELNRLKKDPNAVVYIAWMQARAEAV